MYYEREKSGSRAIAFCLVSLMMMIPCGVFASSNSGVNEDLELRKADFVSGKSWGVNAVSYTHLRAHET